MKQRAILKIVLFCSLAAVVMLSAQVSAQSSSSRRGGRGLYGDWLYGDWQVKMESDGRQRESILTFSRDREGNRTGQWISFWGLSELKDVKSEDDKVSFTRTSRNRQGESTTSKFAGTLKDDGVLSGTISSDRGEYKLTGKRAPRTPRAVGNWEIKYKVGDREITATVVITADKEGKLNVDWKSQGAQTEISDVKYERGKLTFKRKTKVGERQFDSTFAGTLGRDGMSAVIKSERGETAAEAKRIGTLAIGTWNLDIASERGARKQRLKINPDMSALYGAMLIKKVSLEGDKISFKIVRQFGDRKFEMTFEGKIAEAKLTGELKTSRGSQKVTGDKVIRTYRRRPATTR